MEGQFKVALEFENYAESRRTQWDEVRQGTANMYGPVQHGEPCRHTYVGIIYPAYKTQKPAKAFWPPSKKFRHHEATTPWHNNFHHKSAIK
jgi:hypothetical protein